MQPSAIVYFAILLSVVAVASLLINSLSIGYHHRQTNRANMELEAARFDFEKRLAFIKVRLEKTAENWRRQAAAAEGALVDFYRLQQFITQIRVRPYDVSRDFTCYRSVRASIDGCKWLKEMRLRRLHVCAHFGSDADAIYKELFDIVAEIREASHLLAEAALVELKLDATVVAENEAVIWAATPASEDKMFVRIKSVVSRAEQFFGPAIRPPFTETAPDEQTSNTPSMVASENG